MKKVSLIFFSLLVIALFSCNQTTSTTTADATADTGSDTEVAAAVDQLMKGLIDADKDILENITAEGLVYGHSSGKVQNKTEFVNEILSGIPLDYLKIELLDQTIKIIGDAAVVRHIFTSETVNNEGAPVSLRIGNVLVWQLQQGNWKLIARQAYKL